MTPYLAALFLSILIAIISYMPVDAQSLDEVVTNDIMVPAEVLWHVQDQGGGYIVYSVKDLGTLYEVEIARDDAPHEFPYGIIKFTKDWKPVGEVLKIDPNQAPPKVEPKIEPPKIEPPKVVPPPVIPPPVIPPEPPVAPVTPIPEQPPVLPKPEEPVPIEPKPEEPIL